MSQSTPSPFEQARQCVMCGLCVPHCPTYAVHGTEADSPRGRLSMMLGLATGELPLDAQVASHLDACLACRACERACPSKVPYGALIDEARAFLAAREAPMPSATTALRALRDHVLPYRERLGMASTIGRTLSGLRRALPEAGLSQRLLTLAPQPRPARFNAFGVHEPTAPCTGEVALFTGCTAHTDADSLRAALRLLRAWGLRVHVPREQSCCGALHRHAGDPQRADRFALDNREVFGALGEMPLTGVSTGCLAELQGNTTTPLAVEEIARLLLSRLPSPAPRFRPLRARVALHTPCSLRNVLRGADEVATLLGHVPELDVIPLPDGGRCCGAGGTHTLSHPEQADRLAGMALDALAETGATHLLTSNIGCALHLAQAARQRGLALTVEHPLGLLARQLDAPG